MRRFPERVVGLIQQQKDDQKDNRNDQFESRAGTDFIFVLSAPLDVITGRHTDLPSDNTLSIANKAANVASLNVHEYCASKQSVFAGNHARSHNEPDVCYFTQWYLCSVRRGDENSVQLIGVFAKIAGVAYPHGQTLPSVNYGREVFTANRCLDDILHCADRDAITSGSLAVCFNFKIGGTCYAFGI